MKTILVFVLVSASLNLFAQTEKGSFMLGGSASVSRTMAHNSNGSAYPSSTSFGISPTVGYFVINNLAAGTSVSYSRSSVSYSNGTQDTDGLSNNFGIGPFVRYYIPAGPVFVVTEGAYSWSRAHTKSTTVSPPTSTESESTVKSTNFRLAAGTAIFLNKNASLDLLINYKKYDSNTNLTALYLSVGFQLYIPGKK